LRRLEKALFTYLLYLLKLLKMPPNIIDVRSQQTDIHQ